MYTEASILQGPAPIIGLSESSSDDEDSVKRDYDEQALTDLSNLERVFITGVLDELKICFYYNKLVMFQCSCNMKLPFCQATADVTD